MSKEQDSTSEAGAEKKGRSILFLLLAALGSLVAVSLILSVGFAFYKEVVIQFTEGASEAERVTVTEINEIPLGETRESVEEKLGTGTINLAIETENGFLDCNVYETESGKPWRLCFADDLLKSKRKTNKADLS